ncbi:transmembrane protein [Gossypium australe]|uniref:Transmembrane protein n=1 Tax=Gossypium australe TaxID=47621 RepID=A0A5B6UZ05_9ROSI|nr:transmembrane protein [Gossypium australe]
MGSCASVHKSSQESAMKVGLSLGSKTDNIIIPPSPVKEKSDAVNGDFTHNSHSSSAFKDLGSKDETFFDSRAYLDSDCDDDFLSVCGDFTPSRGNTPVHHNSISIGVPKIHKSIDEGSPSSCSEASPGKKKKLVELFRDSVKEDQDVNELNTSINQDTANGKLECKPTIQDILPPKSANGTPYVSQANSRCSSERTANGDNLMFKEKSVRSAQRCLPSLVLCSSSSERRKKMSRATDVNYKP